MISQEYLAGFIDGEGYLGIMKHTNKNCKRNYGYVSAIKIAQRFNEREVLIKINEQFGGYLSKKRIHKNNHSDSIAIEFKGNKSVSKIIDYIYPFLITKGKQADVLREFIKIKTPSTRKPILVDIEMDKMYKQKEFLYNKIRMLNFRGKSELQRLTEETLQKAMR